MFTTVSLQSSLLPVEMQQRAKSCTVPWCGRCVGINWDKSLLLSTMALLVAEIAYVFFSKLPPMFMLGLAFYGMVFLVLYAKAQNTRPSQARIEFLEDELQEQREKYRLLEDNIKGNQSASAAAAQFQQRIQGAEARLAQLREEEEGVKRGIAALKAERKVLGR